MFYMSTKGISNYTNVLNYVYGGAQYTMDLYPYKYDFTLDVWNIAGDYQSTYLFSAEPMEYASSLENNQEVIIELYLSETLSYV